MSNVMDFKADLALVVKNKTLHESQWGSTSWKALGDKINQEILNDAFKQHPILKDLLSGVGNLTIRNCKTIERVNKKYSEQRPGLENYFKVVADFVAVRIHCEVKEIPEKIDTIRAIVLKENGSIHVRGSSAEKPYGLCKNGNQFTDITQYIYIFLEKVGYPIEIQIGHEFASHTFTIDSSLRDNPTCGKVDLWKENFYGMVKKYILDKANGQEPESLEKINAVCAEIHNGNIPQELQQILDKI